MTIGIVLEFLIRNGPGRTETELAEAIFGRQGYQQRVNQDCYLLTGKGTVERRGDGGNTDPFRYFPLNRWRQSWNSMTNFALAEDWSKTPIGRSRDNGLARSTDGL
jgi:hypothetical protein